MVFHRSLSDSKSPQVSRTLYYYYYNYYYYLNFQMRKILIAQIREEIYYSLIRRELFPEEQKGYH